MNKSRYSEQPIAFNLKQAGHGTSFKEICRKTGVSQQTFYKWRGVSSRTQMRKVSAKLREDRHPSTAPNEIWSMNFLSGHLFNGSKIRVLAIVDAVAWLSPAIDVRQHYRGSDVVDTLQRVTAIYGIPKTIRLDNRPEFIFKVRAECIDQN